MADYYAPIITLIVGVSAVNIAYRQWRTAQLQAELAREKFKFDTFERRYLILSTTQQYIRSVLHPHEIEGDADKTLRGYRRVIEQGRFFLPRDITDALDEVLILAGKYHNYQDQIAAGKSAFMEVWPAKPDHVADTLVKISVLLPKAFEEDLAVDILRNPPQNMSIDPTSIRIIILIFLMICGIMFLLLLAVVSSRS